MDTYYRKHQLEDMKDSRSRAVRAIKDPNHEDKAGLQKQIRRIDNDLQRGTPPELTSEQRDKAVKRASYLEGEIQRGMPSDFEMRRNPDGAVGKNQRWEARNQRHCLEYKNLQMAIHPESEDPDLCNIERLRPRTTPQDLSAHGAQIPGRIFSGTNPSQAYLDNYDDTFGNSDTPEPPGLGMGPEEAPEVKSIVEMQLDSEETTATTTEEPTPNS